MEPLYLVDIDQYLLGKDVDLNLIGFVDIELIKIKFGQESEFLSWFLPLSPDVCSRLKMKDGARAWFTLAPISILKEYGLMEQKEGPSA